jgi:pilus assembly protein CpaE
MATIEVHEMNSGPTKARVRDIVEPLSVAAGVFSVAVISPDKQRREAATRALGECPNTQIQEFDSCRCDPNEEPCKLNRDFDAIIIDLDSDPECALNLVKCVHANGLATVMVYSAKSDPDLMLKCMRAGAREFLTLPFKPGAMVEALARASSLRSADRLAKKTDGKLLVFLTAKGGSGVTTLACNFAVSLAQESRQKTLLIDLGLPLGGVALNLGIKTEHSIVDALQDLERLDADFLSRMLEKHGSGLSVLAAPSEMAPEQVSDEAIDKLLEVARQEFSYVVVDGGSKLDLQHTHLFDKSATIYLVVQVGLAELRNSNRLISMLSAPGGPKLEIVINRYDPQSQEIAEEHITEALTRPAEWKIPNDYAAVRLMQNTATPLIQDDSEISRAIRQMARSVCVPSAAPAQKP